MDLQEIRQQLDVMDSTILELFEKRMKLTEEVAKYKIEHNKNVLDRSREKEKLEKLRSLCQDKENELYAVELFKQIIAYSRINQYKILAANNMPAMFPFMESEIKKENVRVVYQGVEGAYSHAATIQYFGEGVDASHVPTFADAMKAISAGSADYAMLPIENSAAGAVSDVYDLLVHYDNYIVGETFVDVKHVLLGQEDAELDDIEVVYSHQQGLSQCSRFISEHSNWKTVAKANTAMSAKAVCEMKDKKVAAIASSYAGKLYGLKELATDITNNDTNTTRFIIVTSKKVYAKKAQKISICFEVSHESGSLYTMLSHFMFNNLNMSKIESRPIPGRSWEYRFFLDFEGNLSDIRVIDALRGVIEESNFFRILGNY